MKLWYCFCKKYSAFFLVEVWFIAMFKKPVSESFYNVTRTVVNQGKEYLKLLLKKQVEGLFESCIFFLIKKKL